jgi:hypothetical protein
MPEIFRVPLATGYLVLHADDDSDTGLSLELHNGEEGVMAPINPDQMGQMLQQIAKHLDAIWDAFDASQEPDTAA